MDSLHSTMNRHVKGKHLSFEERVIIQLRLKDGCSFCSFVRYLNCSLFTLC
ncbi:helix-turn-helix domain-containing protein, partial [Lactobacillus gasseri]|uniref:helix-turn-helix domain-containing protein n=1 Tax=Lactobacillus gasseri TaxID=1596 RepID=UPI000A98D0B7